MLGGMDALNGYDRKLDLVIAVADPSIRFRIKNRIRNSNISFPVIVHPSAMMGDVLVPSIGEGSVICAGCIFTTDIVIEAFSIINLGCTVGHDVKIQKFCSIMPGCSLSGNVTLECGVLVGTGAKILPGLTIGKWSTVGAGAVVTKDISEGITVVGVPARRLN